MKWTDHNWNLYGGRINNDQRGYFYLGIDKLNDRKYPNKFGTTSNPDSRLKLYAKHGCEFEYTHLWHIKRHKLLEKFIKTELYHGAHDRHRGLCDFARYAKYWDFNGQLGWGMSEWMRLPDDSFAKTIEDWILDNIVHLHGHSPSYTHFIPSKTTLYFHEPPK